MNGLNKWQQVYIDTYYNGKMPRTKIGKTELALLGKVKDKITVHYPDFNGIHGLEPAHVETYVVHDTDSDMPNGQISVSVLAGNLELWTSRGYQIDY